MPGLKCCVNDCGSTQYHRGIILHRFPLTQERILKKWVDFVNILSPDFEPKETSRICSLHFLDSEYYTNQIGKKSLTRDAIPSVSLDSDDENDTQFETSTQAVTESEKSYAKSSVHVNEMPETSSNQDRDHLLKKIAELEHQNSLLTKELMNERKNYVEAKDELLSKITELENMNSELICKDFDDAQLELKVAEITKLLEQSRENESLLRVQLVGKTILEEHLSSEVTVLKTKLEDIAATLDSKEKSLRQLETNLVKKENRWLAGDSRGRITKFIKNVDGQKWTGLTTLARKGLYDFLGPAKEELQMWKRDCKSGDMKSMTVDDQFLLCLIILRKDWSYQDVASVFGIDEKIVSSTFITWLQFIYQKYKDEESFFFTKKKDIKKDSLPECFQNKELRETRYVIDCTEFKTQSSR